MTRLSAWLVRGSGLIVLLIGIGQVGGGLLFPRQAVVSNRHVLDASLFVDVFAFFLAAILFYRKGAYAEYGSEVWVPTHSSTFRGKATTGNWAGNWGGNWRGQYGAGRGNWTPSLSLKAFPQPYRALASGFAALAVAAWVGLPSLARDGAPSIAVAYGFLAIAMASTSGAALKFRIDHLSRISGEPD